MLPSKNSQKQQSAHLYHRRTHSAPSTPTTSSSSQTSRGREQVDYPPLPPSSAINEDRAYFNSPQPANKSLSQRRSRSNGSHRYNTPRITYESPRLYHSDIVLFPASKHGPLYNTSYLQSYEARYQYIQSLQGAPLLGVRTDFDEANKRHSNDMSTLRINYAMIHDRKISPKAVQLGILPQCARRVRSLHCPILPQHLPVASKGPRVVLKAIINWIDMIVHTFPNLQHLYVQPPPIEADSRTCESAEGSNIAAALFSPEEIKLFHTFIVYRIPGLQTIDGVAITADDRKEAMQLKRMNATSAQERTGGQIRNKRRLQKAQPVMYCLRDGMKNDDNENNDPSQEANIQATETAVEVRQPTSEKKESTHRPSPDRVIRSPDVYSNPRFFAASSRKSTEEEQWEYASVGESSVHAMAACASWTTACGSLSSALPYFLQKRTTDSNRLKMKLLQNRKRMIQGKIPTTANSKEMSHGGNEECRLDTLTLERDQPVTTNKPSASPFREEKTPVPPSRSNLARSAPNVPPTQSLTLPMQFRSQPHVISRPTLPDANVSEASKGIQALKITTNPIFTSQDSDPLPVACPPTPRVSTSRARISSEASLGGMTNPIEQAYDLTRTQSSPSKLPTSQQFVKATPPVMTASLTVQTKTGALPPPCPGAIRRKMSSALNRSANIIGPTPLNISQSSNTAPFQHRTDHSKHPSVSPWRDATSLRTFSLMDDDDDDHCNDGFVHSDDEDMFTLPSIRMS